MGKGPNFSTTPTWAVPEGEDFSVITNISENFNKELFLVGGTIPTRRFRLTFDSVSDATFATLLTHWRAVSGSYQPFWWNAVPSYIDGGSGSGVSMYGRWAVGEEPRWNPNARSWNVEVVFERDHSKG